MAVWQIAQRDYHFGKGKHRSLTPATYDAIGNHFRSLWGKEAGWAHSVLFTADLRAFSERLHTKVESTEVKLESGADNPEDKVIKREIELDTAIKLGPEQGAKRTLVVQETARTTRAKRRKTS